MKLKLRTVLIKHGFHVLAVVPLRYHVVCTAHCTIFGAHYVLFALQAKVLLLTHWHNRFREAFHEFSYS